MYDDAYNMHTDKSVSKHKNVEHKSIKEKGMFKKLMSDFERIIIKNRRLQKM